ncbi:unnamed protein product, partial [Musa acuminata subsp. burmannicoides]
MAKEGSMPRISPSPISPPVPPRTHRGSQLAVQSLHDTTAGEDVARSECSTYVAGTKRPQ